MNEIEHLTQRQRSVFDQDNMTAYAWRVRKYFVDCDFAIDIGCGIGYQTAAISRLLPNTNFIMLDKSGDEQSINYSEVGYAHNNLALTQQYAQQHINGSVYNVDLYDWSHAAQVVYSTLSWGWHYPVEVYLDQVLKIAPQYIILDTRNKISIKNYQRIDSFRINRKEDTVVFKSLSRN
jgi:hypothetical protein